MGFFFIVDTFNLEERRCTSHQVKESHQVFQAGAALKRLLLFLLLSNYGFLISSKSAQADADPS